MDWKISTDEKFKKGKIIKGKAFTSYEVDWTIKVNTGSWRRIGRVLMRNRLKQKA